MDALNNCPPSPPQVTLHLLKGSTSSNIPSIKLEGKFVTLGRAETNTVVLNSMEISRNHCSFRKIGWTWYVVNQSNTNGISVNDERVPKGKKKPIHNGDILNLVPGGILDYAVRVKQGNSGTGVKGTMEQKQPKCVIDKETIGSSLEFRCQQLEEENEILFTRLEKFFDDLNTVKLRAQAETKQVYTKFWRLIEDEFNCPICCEICIGATVIDCGHTFCQHCITQCYKEKKVCPTCRRGITMSIKPRNLENFIDGVHKAMTPEIRESRVQAINDRKDEIAIAKAAEQMD